MAPLFEALAMPYEITPLEFGDCAFIGNGPDGPVRVGIEIKGGRGGSDFLQSMQSGRLVGHQIPGLVAAYDRCYLMVEGIKARRGGLIWMPPRRRGEKARPIFVSDIEKFLTGVEEWGVRVRYTNTPAATARVIVKILYAFWAKDYGSHSSVNTLYTPPAGIALRTQDEATTRLRRVACALPGIGYQRSKDVAETFGSIERLANADLDAWEGITGIGKTIAREAHGAIREPIQAVPTGVVSTKRGSAHRSTRNSRKHQDTRVDERGAVERCVHAFRAGYRKLS